MKRILLLSGFLFLALIVTNDVNAQFLKKLKKEVSKRVENKVIRDAGRGSEKIVDRAEKEAGAIISSGNEKSNDQASSVYSNNEEERAHAVSGKSNGQRSNPSIPVGPGRNVNVNYDFEPGEQTIFDIDFTKEQLGNFPRRLEFISGNLAVVEWNGERFGRVQGRTQFAIPLPEDLPDKFTIQLRLYDTYWLGYVHLTTTKKVEKGEAYFALYDRHGVGVVTKDGPASTGDHKAIEKKAVPIEIMVDGTYAKMYVDGNRVANIPQVNIKRTDKLYFTFEVSRDKPEEFGYITDIRVAGGGKTLYQKLEAEGRVAIHDIHFATGKADILPESAESIKAVADVLKEHADIRLLIEGHTDNTGNFDKNMELSKERAAAVKIYLMDKFGIADNRLKTMGRGQTSPVASNNTEEGRAQNRRVEIVKM